jgi:hypothetical protein
MNHSFYSAALVTGFLLAFSTGCTTHAAKVNAVTRSSIARMRPGATSYRINQVNHASDDETLRVKEAARNIRTALSAHGLWEAPPTVPADLIVDINYGMESRMVDQEKTRPVYGPLVDGNGRMIGRELIAFEKISDPHIVYDKHLSVACRETNDAPDKPEGDLWRVTASIEDTSKDLREYLPILASAVMTRIEEATNGTVTERPTAEAISFVKQGL